MTQVRMLKNNKIVTITADKPYLAYGKKLFFVDFSQTTAQNNFCTITFEDNKQKDYLVNVRDVKQ